jgi:hypothetical protein
MRDAIAGRGNREAVGPAEGAEEEELLPYLDETTRDLSFSIFSLSIPPEE